MEFLANPKLIQEYGFAVILFTSFLLLLWRQTKQAEKRFSKIEKDLDSANNFIRNEMSLMIRDQQKVIIQNNEALIQHAKDFKDLGKIIGRLGKINDNEKPYEKNFKSESQSDSE
jgi:hypothetical protein